MEMGSCLRIVVLLCVSLTIAASSIGWAHSGYIENVEVSGCATCQLQLVCRHMQAIIAIRTAEFIPDGNLTFDDVTAGLLFPPMHPRKALNKRCSGVSYCNFVLQEDCPGAVVWGPGQISVRYSCIYGNKIKSFCNSTIILPRSDDVALSEGFIRNPGYPRFYASHKKCSWKIVAPPQQRLRITLLDLALNGHSWWASRTCTDQLQVIDSKQLVLSTCRSQEPPLTLISNSNSVELVLVSTHSLTPMRGVLIHYSMYGCTTPSAPDDGYLVYRTDTLAEFRCSFGFTFSDTNQRHKIISCLGSFWNATLPLANCEKGLDPFLQLSRVRLEEEEMASELIAPVAIITTLFVLNFLVIYYIHKKRQRVALRCEERELGGLNTAV